MDAQRWKHRLDRLAIEAQREIAEGSPDKGAELCRKLISDWIQIQGSDGEKVLVWRGFLGRALVQAHRFNEAEEVLSSLLVDRERLLGPDDPSVLVTRGNLARAIAFAGRPQEAIFHARRLLSDRMRLLGPDHPSTLDSVGHLANFHSLDGQHDVAAEMYEELLTRRIEVLGEDHPDVFQTEVNMLLCQSKAGHDVDIDALRDVVDAMHTAYGPEHPETINVVLALTAALSRTQQHAEALHVANLALDAAARTLGELDPKTLNARVEVVRALVGLGRPLEAITETMKNVRAHDENRRGDEVTGLSAAVIVLNWCVSQDRTSDEFFEDQIHLEIRAIADWLESSASSIESSVEYRKLAVAVRERLASVKPERSEKSAEHD